MIFICLSLQRKGICKIRTDVLYTVLVKSVFLILTVQTLYGLYVSINTFDVENVPTKVCTYE